MFIINKPYIQTGQNFHMLDITMNMFFRIFSIYFKKFKFRVQISVK
jgi:hypothetical protein